MPIGDVEVAANLCQIDGKLTCRLCAINVAYNPPCSCPVRERLWGRAKPGVAADMRGDNQLRPRRDILLQRGNHRSGVFRQDIADQPRLADLL